MLSRTKVLKRRIFLQRGKSPENRVHNLHSQTTLAAIAESGFRVTPYKIHSPVDEMTPKVVLSCLKAMSSRISFN